MSGEKNPEQAPAANVRVPHLFRHLSRLVGWYMLGVGIKMA